jgi:E3 ubiquitin-protein ligase RNF14
MVGALFYLFQVCIRYDLPDGVEVDAKFPSASASPRDVGCCDGPDEFSYTCNLEHLPPLILACLLPRSYPSREPPCFVVTAKWVDGPHVSQLCEMLDNIWAEFPGQEVIYQWIEWLRNYSMSYIWPDGRLMLGPDTVTCNGDDRAISRTLSLEFIIPLMLSYRNKKQFKSFLDDLQMCMICLNQSKGNKDYIFSFLFCCTVNFDVQSVKSLPVTLLLTGVRQDD